MSSPHHLSAIAIATAIPLLSVIFLALALLYYHLRLRRPPEQGASSSSGLDPAVLQSLPVSVYRSKEGDVSASTMECAVCISEVSEGEKYRILPGCGHGFHLDCVDMWFHSHSTCPLCRASVGPTATTNNSDNKRISRDHGYYYSTDLPILPTNVLFWGNLDRVTTGGSPSTTPTPASSSSSSLSSSSSSAVAAAASEDEDDGGDAALEGGSVTEAKPPAVPPARTRSLRRFLGGRDWKIVGCSSRWGGDIERGRDVSIGMGILTAPPFHHMERERAK